MRIGGIFDLFDRGNQVRPAGINDVCLIIRTVSSHEILTVSRHTIVGGVIGVGIAALGADGVQWGWSGVASIFAAWFIAPGIAGCFAAIIFLITKYGVLKRKNPFRAGLISIPFYFALTSGVLVMLIVWKGGQSLLLEP